MSTKVKSLLLVSLLLAMVLMITGCAKKGGIRVQEEEDGQKIVLEMYPESNELLTVSMVYEYQDEETAKLMYSLLKLGSGDAKGVDLKINGKQVTMIATDKPANGLSPKEAIGVARKEYESKGYKVEDI